MLGGRVTEDAVCVSIFKCPSLFLKTEMNRPLSLRLLSDINPLGSSKPSLAVALGDGRALFSAAGKEDDRELWITRGNAKSTKRVKDINPDGSASPEGITPIGNGQAVFAATDDTGDTELWVTDGTSAGTHRVLDINAKGSSKPDVLTPLGNGKTLFAALDSDGDKELWTTDGTAEGTRRLKNVNAVGSSSPYLITPLGDNRALFVARSHGFGVELWITDGTEEGTTQVRDINPNGSARPAAITAIGEGRALFYAEDGEGDSELWITDGTEDGTRRLKNINPLGSSLPEGFTPLGDGRTLFSARRGTEKNSVRELWVTDGTQKGTRQVKAINTRGQSLLSEITALGNGKAIFSADDGVAGEELWITDGTTSGTHIVKDINANGGSAPGAIASLGNGLAVFSADDGIDGRELWVTDGTTEGTQPLPEINPKGDANPSMPVSIGNNRLLFSASDGTNGRELWSLLDRSSNSSNSGGDKEEGNTPDDSNNPDSPSQAMLEKLLPAADGLSLKLTDLDINQTLSFDLEGANIRGVSELLVFSLADDGSRNEIARFSLLESGKLGGGFAQKSTLASGLPGNRESLQFELVGNGRTRLGRLVKGDRGEVTLDFGGGTALKVGLQSDAEPNLLHGDAQSIDLSQYAQETVSFDFFVYRDADFDNTVGFYRTDDAEGNITDPFTGKVVRPGDEGYRQMMLSRQIDLSLTGQNGQVNTFTADIAGGGFMGMFLVADGEDPTSGELYYSHVGMNSNGNDHVKFLGDNTFGFEDSAGLGDRDFNDMVVRFEARVV